MLDGDYRIFSIHWECSCTELYASKWESACHLCVLHFTPSYLDLSAKYSCTLGNMCCALIGWGWGRLGQAHCLDVGMEPAAVCHGARRVNRETRRSISRGAELRSQCKVQKGRWAENRLTVNTCIVGQADNNTTTLLTVHDSYISNYGTEVLSQCVHMCVMVHDACQESDKGWVSLGYFECLLAPTRDHVRICLPRLGCPCMQVIFQNIPPYPAPTRGGSLWMNITLLQGSPESPLDSRNAAGCRNWYRSLVSHSGEFILKSLFHGMIPDIEISAEWIK